MYQLSCIVEQLWFSEVTVWTTKIEVWWSRAVWFLIFLICLLSGVKALRNFDIMISCYLKSPLVRLECSAFRRNVHTIYSLWVRAHNRQHCSKVGSSSCLRFLWPWLHWLWRWLSEKFDNIFETLIGSYRKQNMLVITKNIWLLSRCFVLIMPNIWMLRNIWTTECIFKVGGFFNVSLCLLSWPWLPSQHQNMTVLRFYIIMLEHNLKGISGRDFFPR